MRIYAFDVDDTLEVSGGPVLLTDLLHLRAGQGHVVGICGNWAVFCNARPGSWWKLASFIGPAHGGGQPKRDFLGQLRTYVRADDYVMVGNDPATDGGASDDRTEAEAAGWRFILARDFAEGKR